MSPVPTSDLFSFDDVSVVLDGRPVLRDLDLSIADSGISVVLGPSGSGKSTLTRLTNRLLDPTAGTVSLRGAELRSLDVLAVRRVVGMVFQRPTLFAGTVLDNLLATGVTDPAAHADALAAVGLDRVDVAQSAATLSGGEAQRVCLARTLLMRPEVLVADEPTSSLDHAATLVLERLARDLADAGVPILWVTHDLAQADRIADHRVVLDAGLVVR